MFDNISKTITILDTNLLFGLLRIVNHYYIPFQVSKRTNYYVIFIGQKHRVCDSWLEYQRRVLLYKGSLPYTSKDEAMRAWVLHLPQWKRPDGAAASSLLTPKNGHKKKQCMKIMSTMLFVCFIIGIFTTLMFVIVISKVL